jgi:cyclopropane fatty-acyl-phospholipid synthase-like methyltransferase
MTMTQDIFLDEYSADAALKKYRRKTAGHGITYLLDHDYGAIYRRALESQLPDTAKQKGVRLLEFGCGAGMNLIHVVSMVGRMGIPLDCAYGTDFSEKLLHAARRDATHSLKPALSDRVKFLTARNEAITKDLTEGLNVAHDALLGSFHMIFGVNTFRYCYRIDKEKETASQIFELLDAGGVCVMIDMNAQFRFFRDQLRRRVQVQEKQYYIPKLEEYARPFAEAGFQILEARNFCWIPHSAGAALTTACRLAAPALNAVAPRHALRSLVLAKKPAR